MSITSLLSVLNWLAKRGFSIYLKRSDLLEVIVVNSYDVNIWEKNINFLRIKI